MSISTTQNGKLKFTASGFAYRQNPQSPQLFAFVASSNELLRFCGVARKSEGLLANYQRALDKGRVEKEITPFFQDTSNCSPTAVVISLQSSSVAQIALDPPPGDGIKISTLTLEFSDTSSLGGAELISLAKKFLDDRLSVDEDEGSSEEDNGDDDDGQEEVDAEDDEDSSTIEIGRSMLRSVREQLEDEQSLTPDFRKALRDMLFPALIIDGQHRLYGAAGVEEDIPVLVCALIEPTWREQVFQFIVVNDKAKSISKPFITSLAGMSLTSGELEKLKDRLSQAGIKLWEVDVMQRLGYDSSSPFANRINFKVSSAKKAGSKKLGYQTMKRVGKAWYEPGKGGAGLYKLMAAIYTPPGGKVSTKKSLREEWQQ